MKNDNELDRFFNLSIDMLCIADTKGYFKIVNDAFIKTLGYSKQELYEHPFVHFVHPDDLDATARAVAALAHGQPITYFENRYRCRDGSYKWLEWTTMPVAAEGITYSVARDINTSKQAEDILKKAHCDLERRVQERTAELRTANERMEREIEERRRAVDALRIFSDALENATDAIGMSTPEGQHYYQNKAFDRLFGTIGKHPETVYVDKKVGQDVFRTIESGGTWTGEARMYARDGRIVDIDLRAYANTDAEGRIISLVGVHTDITGRKRAEREKSDLQAQLNRAEKMETIGTLAGCVAHDLNNILGAIVGYPELMLDDLPGGSPLRKPLLAIQESGERAASIVHDLLTLARRGIAVTEPENLNTLIKRYLGSREFLKLQEVHPNVRVETNLAPDLLNILGSPVHLSKVVMNLVANAAEAMPRGGTITIATDNTYLDRAVKGYDKINEGDYVVLRVADDGIGIPAEDLKRVFEPFYTKKVMGRSGTGLGMAVVWGTVKDHRGYIDVVSTEGAGTTFTLYFPVTRQVLRAGEKPVPIEAYLGSGQRVLVIDDVAAQRELASSMLEKLNYTVTAVDSGEAAVAYLQDHAADLLVLDMIMEPGINGLETYRRVLHIRPQQRAIIASGFSESDDVKEAQRLGAGAYIKKPYTLEKIGLAVRAELKNPRARRAEKSHTQA